MDAQNVPAPVLTRSRRRALWLLVAILLAGAALRLYGLYHLSPPGLEHDEVANWLIDRAILNGQGAVYFREAYGHEAGYHYVQALFVALLGDHALALRLPAAFSGILLIAVSFSLGRRLFPFRIAVIAAALLAVLFWPVFYSRLGLRAISLPLLSGLSAIFWWRGWQARDGARWPWAVAGLFAGLSLHTYMAARVVPIFYLLFLLYLLLLQRPALRRHRSGILIFWLVLLLAASPLLLFLVTNPGIESRIGEIDAPLRALLRGDLRPAVDNFVDILGMFGFSGDPLWRQNVASDPVFDPFLALLFYTCLPLCLIYVRDVRYAFIILWLFTATIPSIVTIDAPSSIRIINILPLLTLLPAMVMHNLGHLSTKKGWLSTGGVEKWAVGLLVAALFFYHAGHTARAIFVVWPANDEVRFVWQEALTDGARYLDTLPGTPSVAIGGWTPASMDPPTMALSLRRDDLQLRYFQPQQALLLPAVADGASAQILVPALLPVDPLLASPLAGEGVITTEWETFTTYVYTQMPALKPMFPEAQEFGDVLAFQGYSPAPTCFAAAATTCTLATYWRVLRTPTAELRFFMHAVDDEGAILANGDGLDAPSLYWQPGDVVLQRHELNVSLRDVASVRLGVYQPEDGQRLLTPAGDDSVRLRELSLQ